MWIFRVEIDQGAEKNDVGKRAGKIQGTTTACLTCTTVAPNAACRTLAESLTSALLCVKAPVDLAKFITPSVERDALVPPTPYVAEL